MISCWNTEKFKASPNLTQLYGFRPRLQIVLHLLYISRAPFLKISFFVLGSCWLPAAATDPALEVPVGVEVASLAYL